MKTPEAQAHLDAITKARGEVKTLMGVIRKHQTALIGVCVKAYNLESATLDGMIAETSRTVIGYEPCEPSPIGVCVYNDNVMSLPSQRMGHHAPGGQKLCHPQCGTDACLFCGSPMDKDHEYEGRRQIVPAT